MLITPRREDSEAVAVQEELIATGLATEDSLENAAPDVDALRPSIPADLGMPAEPGVAESPADDAIASPVLPGERMDVRFQHPSMKSRLEATVDSSSCI